MIAEAGADGLSPDQSNSKAHKTKVDELVKPLMDGKWSPGLVVGFISAGGSEIYAYGKRSTSGGAPDGDTLFEIGSVTKTFTSLALAAMIKDGKVTLKQKINDLLPVGKVKVPAYSGQDITLVQISTHTSGLPRMPSNFAPKNQLNPYVDYTTPLLYSFLNAYTLPRAPGTKWEYSNLATGLMGHGLALKAGKTYEALISDRITKVLKMKDTAITLSAEQTKRTAQGHNYDLAATSAWDFDVLAPCGAIRSTARDMLTYLAAQSGLTSSPLDGAMGETHKVHYSGSQIMGLGWIHLNARYLWHNGGTYGFETFAGFDKKAKVGVVVLSNALTTWGSQTKLGITLLAMMAGDTYSPVDIPKTVTVPTASLNLLTGSYKAMGSTVIIQRNGGDLYFNLTGQPAYRMYATSPSIFYLRASKSGITFSKDTKGKYSSFVLSSAAGKTTFTK